MRSTPWTQSDSTARLTVEKLDRSAEAEAAKSKPEVERDPLFDDESSLLLDAALGLGDEAKTDKGSKAKPTTSDDDFLLD